VDKEKQPVMGDLGQKLRELYDSVVNEPIPPRIAAILEQLKGPPSGPGKK
jgi:Anti-sigma factor NepR